MITIPVLNLIGRATPYSKLNNNNSNNNNYFFCANILEDQAQWRDKTKGLSTHNRKTRTGFTCTHLKSSGNELEQSDAFMMSVIGLIKTFRHAFSSMVGSRSRSQDLLGDDMIIFLTSAVVAGSKDAS